jgi:hypothetical protein
VSYCVLRIIPEKNPTASAGSEPAILGSRGQHANPETTEAAKIVVVVVVVVV